MRSIIFNFGKVLLYLILIVGLFIFLFPFYQMVIGSFKSEVEIFTTRPSFLPERFKLDNYNNLFTHLPFARNVFNSFFVSSSSTLFTLFFCSLAGFTFAKHKFPGRDFLFSMLLITMMLPGQVTLIPLFILMRRLNWINTYYPLIIPGAASAFGIFLMRQYTLSSIPDDLIDAARIDGCSEFGIYAKIGLPIILPGLTALGILTFMGSWNSFLWPLIVLNDFKMYTIPIALSLLQSAVRGEILYGSVFAGATIGTFPLLVIFLIFQRQFVSGILAGALKS
jgi:ABC-type glycerol-3-phosphate transport system permease component